MSERPPDNPFGSPPPNDPFGGSSSGGPDPAVNEAWRTAPQPQGSYPPPPPPTAGRVNAQGAVASLVLGIVGIVFCPLCAPFAWVMGRKAEGLVDASGGTLSGRGEATAGKILGMIVCALLVLGVIALIALIAVGSSIDTSSSGGSFTVD